MKNYIKIPLFLLLGVAILYLASRGIEFDTIWEIIIQADVKWVLASGVMGYVAMIARGLRWSFLLEPMGYFPKKWNNINAVALSYFVSLGIPRSGELVRCTALNQAEDIPVDKLFGTVILERVIDTSILLLFIGMAFLFNYDVFASLLELAQSENTGTLVQDDRGFLEKYWWLILIAAIVILLIVLRKKLFSGKLKEKAENFLLGMKEGFLSIKKLDKKWGFALYSICIWGMYYLSMISMLRALHMDPFGWNEALFLVVAGGLGVIVPTQNGVGTYHILIEYGVLVLALSYAFWPEKSNQEIREIGYSLAWLQWGTQTIMMLIVGLIATISFALQKKKRNVVS